jgi:hypothetical protein
MSKELKAIDVSSEPVLLRLAEEVRDAGEPRVLRRNQEDLAILAPVLPAREPRARRSPSQADFTAFLSSAGSWSDVDTDSLVDGIYTNRSRSARPPVEL